MRYFVYAMVTLGLLLLVAGIATGQWLLAAFGAAFTAYYVGSAKWLARREDKHPVNT
jgi:type IV secretory pathway TrbD component